MSSYGLLTPQLLGTEFTFVPESLLITFWVVCFIMMPQLFYRSESLPTVCNCKRMCFHFMTTNFLMFLQLVFFCGKGLLRSGFSHLMFVRMPCILSLWYFIIASSSSPRLQSSQWKLKMLRCLCLKCLHKEFLSLRTLSQSLSEHIQSWVRCAWLMWSSSLLWRYTVLHNNTDKVLIL